MLRRTTRCPIDRSVRETTRSGFRLIPEALAKSWNIEPQKRERRRSHHFEIIQSVKYDCGSTLSRPGRPARKARMPDPNTGVRSFAPQGRTLPGSAGISIGLSSCAIIYDVVYKTPCSKFCGWLLSGSLELRSIEYESNTPTYAIFAAFDHSGQSCLPHDPALCLQSFPEGCRAGSPLCRP